MRFVVDASAFYRLLGNPLKASEILLDSMVLDLTLYELGNVVWLGYRRGLVRDYGRTVALLRDLFSLARLLRIRVEDVDGIMAKAVELGLTYYDASYVYYAEKYGVRVLTADKELLAKAGDLSVDLGEVL